MAKFKTLSGKTNSISCDILNESASDYIVQFKNGVIRNVPKSRVYDLDNIDEGVLDTLRSAGKKLRDIFVDVVKKGRKLFFNIDGETAQMVVPVNIMSAAQEIDGLSFVPGKNTIAIAKHFGITPVEVIDDENDSTEKDTTGEWSVVPFRKFEDMLSNGTIAESLKINEDYDEYKDEDEDPTHPFIRRRNENGYPRLTTTELMTMLMEQFNNVQLGKANGYPICLWGAPGLGKTSIISTFAETIKQDFPTFDFIAVNAAGMRAYDFTYPVQIDKQGKDKDGNIVYSKEAVDLVKSWIPAYLPKKGVGSAEYNALKDDIVNGGHDIDGGEDTTKEWTEGDGGILFIDEFSRIPKPVMQVLMSMFSDRMIGQSGYKMGSKWFIVCAANRKSDMTNDGDDNDQSFENAYLQRVESYDYDMTPEEWLIWAKDNGYKNKLTGTTEPNVLPVITNFISNPKYQKFYYFVQKTSTDDAEFGSTKIANASPRRWTLLSNAVRNIIGASDTLNYGVADPEDLKKDPALAKLVNRIEKIVKVYKSLKSKYKGMTFGQYTKDIEVPIDTWDRLAKSILGERVASEFIEYFRYNARFSPDDAKRVWTEGEKVATTFHPDLEGVKNTVNAIITNNPNDGRSTDLAKIPVDQLINIMKYFNKCAALSDAGASGTRDTYLKRAYADLGRAIKSKYKIDVTTDPAFEELQLAYDDYSKLSRETLATD